MTFATAIARPAKVEPAISPRNPTYGLTASEINNRSRTKKRVLSTPKRRTSAGDANAPKPKHKTGIAARTAVSELLIFKDD
jgi:hypothetical protein